MVNFLTLLSLLVTNKELTFVLLAFVVGIFVTRDFKVSVNATLKIALALFIMQYFFEIKM